MIEQDKQISMPMTSGNLVENAMAMRELPPGCNDFVLEKTFCPADENLFWGGGVSARSSNFRVAIYSQALSKKNRTASGGDKNVVRGRAGGC